MAATKASGSVGATPKSCDRINRDRAIASTNPTDAPTNTSRTPWRAIMPTTDARLAPNAILTPISRVRCPTANAISP